MFTVNTHGRYQYHMKIGNIFLTSFMTNQKRFTTSKLIVLLISSVWLEINIPV